MSTRIKVAEVKLFRPLFVMRVVVRVAVIRTRAFTMRIVAFGDSYLLDKLAHLRIRSSAGLSMSCRLGSCRVSICTCERRQLFVFLEQQLHGLSTA